MVADLMVAETVLEGSSVIGNCSQLTCDQGYGYGMLVAYYVMMVGNSVAGHVIRARGYLLVI